MASGDVVAVLWPSSCPSTTAGMPWVAGGSTVAERTAVWAFDDSTNEYVDFLAWLRGYDGGGLTIRLAWSRATGTSSQDVVWQAAIRALDDDAADGDLDASFTYDFNTLIPAAPSAATEIVYDSFTFGDGADMDNWANGEMAIIRIYRWADLGSDTLTGDAYLLGPPEVYET